MDRKKERKKTDNPREGWEDGTPPPHRDFAAVFFARGSMSYFLCHAVSWFGVASGASSLRMDAASAHRRDTAPAAAAVRSPLRARALQGNIPSIKSLLVLDSDGKRIISRYYKGEFASLAEVPPQPARPPAPRTLARPAASPRRRRRPRLRRS